MRIIGDDNATADGNGEATLGGPGGSPPATVIAPDVANSWQREFLNLLTAGAITQDKTVDNQLLLALRALFPERAETTTNIQLAKEEIALSNWESQANTFGGTDVLDIAHNGLIGASSLWVAVGTSGELATSPDGKTWTSRTNPISPSSINSVIYSSALSLWIAGGASGLLATSADGVTWTARTSNFGADAIHGMAVGGGSIVVIGGKNGKISTSTDGITWTARTSSFGTDGIFDIYYDQGLYVAVGENIKLATSTDAITWVVRASGDTVGTNLIRTVYKYNGLWIASSGANTILTSSDGIIWIKTAAAPGIADITKIVGVGLHFIAVGRNDSTGVAVSTDALVWKKLTNRAIVESPQGVQSIAIGQHNNAVIVLEDGVIATSLSF